jgi:hypothetical protein
MSEDILKGDFNTRFLGQSISLIMDKRRDKIAEDM